MLNISKALEMIHDNLRPNSYKLKEYVIKDGKRHPFALICPGGAYEVVCSFQEGTPYAKELNKKGISAFVLYYSCRNKARYPAPQLALKRALEEILSSADRYNISPDDFSVWGSSAGGHLCASFMAYKDELAPELPYPKALVLAYPVITMGEYTHAQSRGNLLGDTAAPDMVEKLSIENADLNSFPPAFVWCGDADKSVNPKNSEMLVKRLEDAGIAVDYRCYPGVEHGAGVGEGTACEGWIDAAVDFWKKQSEKK